MLDPELRAAIDASEERLLPLLVGLARWCDERELYRERDIAWAGVLAIDPTIERALEALRYRRIGRDEWRQSPTYRLPRNHGEPADLEQLERHRAAALNAHRQTLLGPAMQRELPRAVRRTLARRYLRVDPDHTGAHAILGEVLDDGEWILFESRAKHQNRSKLFERAEAALDESDPDPIDPNASEREIDLSWRSARGTRRVRVLGTMMGREVRETARLAHAVGSFYRDVFGSRFQLRPDFTIYLLRGPEERERLLDGYAVEGPTRQILGGAAGGWIDADRSAGRAHLLGEWDPRTERRRDGAVRQALGTLLLDEQWIGARHAWVWEGVGLYLCYRLTGTRETWFFQPGESGSGAVTPLWTELQTPKSDWLALARDVWPTLEPDYLAGVLARHLNQMSDVDLLVSYVLAGYLLEGRPLETPVILRRIGHGEESAIVLSEVLDVDVRELQQRLSRYIEETK